jgi:CXXC-20-CXXC protein
MRLSKSRICPKCQGEISGKQIWKHSWRSPIICKSCGAQIQFHREQWKQLSFPMLIVTILMLLTSFLGKTILGKKLAFYLNIVVFVVFIIIGIRFFIAFQTQLKLELIKKTDNSAT